jgi:hypothetical protein
MIEIAKCKFGLGSSAAEQLTSHLNHKNYIIMINNYFTPLDFFFLLYVPQVTRCVCTWQFMSES